MNAEQETKTLYIDYDKCIGCETCEAVCKFLYGQPRIVLVRTVAGEMVPLYCRHCDAPHCVKVCKNKALSVAEDGAVTLDIMKCRGCETRNCILGCPYGGMLASGEICRPAWRCAPAARSVLLSGAKSKTRPLRQAVWRKSGFWPMSGRKKAANRPHALG